MRRNVTEVNAKVGESDVQRGMAKGTIGNEGVRAAEKKIYYKRSSVFRPRRWEWMQ